MRRLLLSWVIGPVLCFYCIQPAWSQESAPLKIKGTYKSQSLDLVLLDLNISYGLEYEVADQALDLQEVNISQSFTKRPLAEAIRILLEGTGLNFEIVAPNKIVLYRSGSKNDSPQKKLFSPPKNFDVTVSGVVKDKDTGESLPFASILVKDTNNGAATNVDGYFTLFKVPADTSTLVVQYLGHQTYNFQLQPNMDLGNVVIELENLQQQLEEVVVFAVKDRQLLQAATGISTIGVSPEQIATLPSFGEKDIFRSLQLLPGISGTNENSAGLYVRGGTPDQNLILFDGFTVYHVDHLFGFFSAFNANAVKDVQIYKGGFDARFGGRLSSVVELTGKDGNTEEFNAGLGLSLLSVNGFGEVPFAGGKGSMLVAGRRSFQSSFYNNLFDSFTDANDNIPEGVQNRFGQQQVQPNSYFYDLNAKVTYRPTNKDLLSISFYNGQDDLDNSRLLDNNSFGRRFGSNLNFSFQSETTDLTQWGNWGSSMKWSRKWNNRLYSNANLSYSNYYSQRDRANTTTVTRGDSSIIRTNGTYEYNDLEDVTFKLDNEFKINQSNQLEFGFQTTYNDIRYEFTQNDTSNILDRLDQGWTTAVYLQDQHIFADQLILKGGLRATSYSVTGQLYLEPRASATFLLNDHIKMKAAWGRYYQFATRIIREDIQQGSRDFWLLANDGNVPVGSAEHFIAGMSYETSNWLFDVEGYYKPLDGLSEYTTRFAPTGIGRDRTLQYEELFFNGSGIAKGIEFLIQKKVGKMTGWLGYTLGQVQYDFEAFGDEPFPANQDQTHEIKIVGNYQLNNWTFGTTFIYGTGKPYTAPTGYYELGLLDGSSADFFEVSGKNALRLPAYHRLDFSAYYDFQLGTSQASLGLSLFNIYDRQNIWYKEYEVIEGELFETDISLLDFTPSLFFNWSLR